MALLQVPSIGEVVAGGQVRLSAAGIAAAGREARVLLAAAIGCEPATIPLRQREPLAAEQGWHFQQLIQRRVSREPLQYILGYAEFYSLRLHVTPDVLIPRPETELLVEAILQRVQDIPAVELADLGTGSGAIAIALAVQRPDARVHAVDLAPAALAIAADNAARLGVNGQITFHHGSWCEPLLAGRPTGTIQAIAANPPYVTPAEFPHLQPEVRDYEPPLALLTAAADPLMPYRTIAGGAAQLLADDGWLIMECAPWQAAPLHRWLAGQSWRAGVILCDYAGRPRLVAGQRPVAQPPVRSATRKGAGANHGA